MNIAHHPAYTKVTNQLPFSPQAHPGPTGMRLPPQAHRNETFLANLLWNNCPKKADDFCPSTQYPHSWLLFKTINNSPHAIYQSHASEFASFCLLIVTALHSDTNMLFGNKNAISNFWTQHFFSFFFCKRCNNLCGGSECEWKMLKTVCFSSVCLLMHPKFPDFAT